MTAVPRLCLVTDRRRLCGADAGFAAERRSLVSQVRAAAAAGVDLIQVRERDLDGGPLAELVCDLLEAMGGTAVRVVVNDRLDVALACNAAGVHLRGDSIPPAIARTLAPPGFLIGRSVHGAEEARALASSADYLIAGTVFPTSSKPRGHVLLGLAGLTEVVRAARVPVLAIGGITAANAAAVRRTGAAGIAGIGLFLRDPAAVVRAWFDSSPPAF